jgi:hypothetical protein
MKSRKVNSQPTLNVLKGTKRELNHKILFQGQRERSIPIGRPSLFRFTMRTVLHHGLADVDNGS